MGGGVFSICPYIFSSICPYKKLQPSSTNVPIKNFSTIIFALSSQQPWYQIFCEILRAIFREILRETFLFSFILSKLPFNISPFTQVRNHSAKICSKLTSVLLLCSRINYSYNVSINTGCSDRKAGINLTSSSLERWWLGQQYACPDDQPINAQQHSWYQPEPLHSGPPPESST